MDDLTKLAVGDPVVIMANDGPKRVARIEKITKLHFVIGDGKYRRTTGDRAGGDLWHFTWICPPTDDLTNDLKRSRFLQEIRGADWPRLSMANLSAVVAILRASKSDEKEAPR